MKPAVAALWCAAIAVFPHPAEARNDPQASWRWRAGHSYSSVAALRQPATFVCSAEMGRPTVTLFDAGVLAQGPLGLRGGLDLGVRAEGGSGRAPEDRVFAALVRGWHRWDQLVVTAQTEYEADGPFEVQKTTVGSEATWLSGPRGLGQPWSPSVRVRWRPWLGLAHGNVLADDGDPDAFERGAFWRAYARLELHYAVGAGSGSGAAAEVDVESTGWWVFDNSRAEGYVKCALVVPIGHGLSFSASAHAGRHPPRFTLERRIGLGLGYRH